MLFYYDFKYKNKFLAPGWGGGGGVGGGRRGAGGGGELE